MNSRTTFASDAVTALHLKAEAFRLAFADRYRYLADPKQVAVPWRALLSKQYATERRRRIDPRRAAAEVAPGDPWTAGDSLGDSPLSAGGGGSCTAHLCAIDANRNVVTPTQTLVDYFGCGVIVPGTGVLLNNAMLWFDPRPDRPNSAARGV